MSDIIFKVVIDTAFNNNIVKLDKVSYNKTIDVQFGIYQEHPCKGMLTVSLKPSHGWKDWLINIDCLPMSTEFGSAHSGYMAELKKYMDDLFKRMEGYLKDIAKEYGQADGIILAGRSKGAAEAELLVPYVKRAFNPAYLYLGAFEPPKCCSNEYKKNIEKSLFNKGWLTCWHNDIVPGLVPWFKHGGELMQFGKRKLGLSIKDHEKSTTEEEIWYEEYDNMIKEKEKTDGTRPA